MQELRNHEEQITMARVSDICASVPQCLLNSAVSDIHIADIVNHFTEWELIGPCLGLTEADEGDIMEMYPCKPKLRRREALRLWKRMNGSEATYLRLIEVFCHHGRIDVAERLSDMANQSDDATSNYVLEVFSRYLIDCYTDFPHPSYLQWPFLSFKGYVNLEIYQTPLNKKNPDSQLQLNPIDLHSLLDAGNQKTKRKVVLMEGVAGSGKTTLFWYACNQWAQGKLFQDVKVLIHVSFSESEFQSACKLADLISYPDEHVRDSVARAIADVHGEGVCFLLDACDEAPRSLWQSFLGNFVTGKGRNMLPRVSLVLASRSGIVNNYEDCLSSKVVIKGFSKESLSEFIELNLHQNSTDKVKLIEALEMKPELYSLCCYPLNAVILMHLFDYFKDNLPTTQTGLIHPLICNFVIRHLHVRGNQNTNDVPEIENLPNDLPPTYAQSFIKVSQIAFESLIKKKVIDKKFLAHVKIDPIEDDILGLLQIRRTVMTMHGLKKQYSFWHLSIQEYLAAIFISGLENKDQAIAEIYDQNPLSPVLSFYAGMTNLHDSGVQDILFQVLNRDLNSKSVIKAVLSNHNPATDCRRQLLALCNCLYESQNPDLWMKVLHMLTADSKISATTRFSQAAFEAGSQYFVDKIDSPDINFTLPFSHLVLYPTDMLSIGNFARTLCEKLSERSVVYLDVSYCNIGDIEFKALANELHKEVELSKIMLRINNTVQNLKTILSIKRLIQGQSCIAGLLMEDINFLNMDVTFALKAVIEGLCCNSACITLSLSGWNLNSSHILHLALLFVSANITCLILSKNDLRRGMHLLSSALMHTKQLHILDIAMCNIDDDSLGTLGQALSESKGRNLFHLSIEFNQYTDVGLVVFLKYIITSAITLLGARLVTPLQLLCLKFINNLRQTYSLPPLEV